MDPDPEIFNAELVESAEPIEIIESVELVEPVREHCPFPLYVVHPQWGKVDGSQAQLRRAAERLAMAPESRAKFSLLDSLNHFAQLGPESRRAVLAAIDLLAAPPRLKARAESFGTIASRRFPRSAGCASGVAALAMVVSLGWLAPGFQSIGGVLLLSLVGLCVVAAAFGGVRDFRIRRWFRGDLLPDAERRGVDPALLYAWLLTLDRNSNWEEGLLELARQAETLGRTMLRCGKLAPPTVLPATNVRVPPPAAPPQTTTAPPPASAAGVDEPAKPLESASRGQQDAPAEETQPSARYVRERLAPAHDRREQVLRLAHEVGQDFPRPHWGGVLLGFVLVQTLTYYLLPKGELTLIWLAIYGITACWAVSLGDRSLVFDWGIQRWIRKTFLPAAGRYSLDPNQVADELSVLAPEDAALGEDAGRVTARAGAVQEALFNHCLTNIRDHGVETTLFGAMPRALDADEEAELHDGLARMTAKPLRFYPADQDSQALIGSLMQWEQLSRQEQDKLADDVKSWEHRQEERQRSLKELLPLAATYPRPFYGWRGLLLFLLGMAPIALWPGLRDQIFTPLILHAAWIGSVYGSDLWRSWRLARWKRRRLLPRVQSGALDLYGLAWLIASRQTSGWRFLRHVDNLPDGDCAHEQFRYVVRHCGAATGSGPAKK